MGTVLAVGVDPGTEAALCKALPQVAWQFRDDVHQATERNGVDLLLLDAREGPEVLALLEERLQGAFDPRPPAVVCLPSLHDRGMLERLTRELQVERLLISPPPVKELVRLLTERLRLPAAPSMRLKLDELWHRFAPQLRERVTALERATRLLLEGRLDEHTAEHARSAAHNLAGSLGTYGLMEGSRLAREAEQLVQERQPSSVPRLARLVEDLRLELDRGPQSPADEPVTGRVLAWQGYAPERSLRLEAAARERGLSLVAMSEGRPEAVVVDLSGAPSAADALEWVRGWKSQLNPPPVLVLGDPQDFRTRLAMAGQRADAYLPLGTASSAVIRAVCRLIERAEQSVPCVLAVDDDPVALTALGGILEHHKLAFHAIQNPLDFWDSLERMHPDVLMLDIDMPHLSGLELCRVVRTDATWGTLPILILTAHNDPDTLQRAFEAGADDYLVKPVRASELLIRMRNRLERVRSLRASAASDPLTGLADQAAARDEIEHYLALGRQLDQPVCLALITPEEVPQINERQGRSAGDRRLEELGNRLAQFFAGADVTARWQGLEFLVAMFGTEKGAAERRVRQALGSFPARFGLAQAPRDGARLDDLLATARARVGAPAHAPDPQGPDVVVVEDDESTLELLVHALNNRGLRTQVYTDGRAALQGLTQLQPRVVLLDVELPGIGGLELLRHLHSRGLTRKLRVIMLTLRASESEIRQSLELGAFDHVAKPFSLPVLMRRVERALA